MVELYRKHFHSDDLKPTPFLCIAFLRHISFQTAACHVKKSKCTFGERVQLWLFDNNTVCLCYCYSKRIKPDLVMIDTFQIFSKCFLTISPERS